MRTLLRSLLDLRSVYVLTANISVQRIADVLNELLEGGNETIGQTGAEAKDAAAAEAEQSGGSFFHAPPLLKQLLPSLAEEEDSGALGSSGAHEASSSSTPAAEPPRWFAVDDTVRYIPVGGKVKAIQRIVAARGFQLVTVFR